MIRNGLLALILLIAGCCACPEIEPRQPEAEPRLGDAAAIRSSLIPLIDLSSAAFISSVLWIETTEIRLSSDFKRQIPLQAAYTRQDIVAFRPGTDASSFAHEVLHAFWEHRLVPDQSNFLASLDAVLAGQSNEEGHIREALNELSVSVHGDYPDRSYDTEMYAYIGELVMSPHEFPIPEAILRHYRGVITEAIIERRNVNHFMNETGR